MYVILLSDTYACKPIRYFTDIDKAKHAMCHMGRNRRFINYTLVSLNLSASDYTEYKQGVNHITYEGKMYNDICTCLLLGDCKILLKIRR